MTKLGDKNPPNRLLSRAEVEDLFGISRRFLEIAAVRGDGPPMIKIGRSVRYSPTDILAYMDARRVNSTSQSFK